MKYEKKKEFFLKITEKQTKQTETQGIKETIKI